MKKNMKILLICIGCILIAAVLVWCVGEKNREPLNVSKVTYICYAGDIQCCSMYVFTSDCHAKMYDIQYSRNKGYDLAGGEMPPEDEYTVTDFNISEEAWKEITDAVTKADFMHMDEELPRVDAFDAPSYYVKVEAGGDVHVSGGCNAGFGKDRESKRFKIVLDAIQKNCI